MHSFGLGVLLILLSAFGFGLMPIFAAYAYAGLGNLVQCSCRLAAHWPD